MKKLKRLIRLILCVALMLSMASFAQRTGAKDTKQADSIAKSQQLKGNQAQSESSAKGSAVGTAVVPPKDTTPAKERKYIFDDAHDMTVLIITIAFFLIMALLYVRFFKHIKERRQRIGFQSIKLIGLILMFPGICILALAGNGVLNEQTLGVLLGTIAGYILSKEDDPASSGKKEKDEDDALIKTLEERIAAANKILKEKSLPEV